MEKSSQAICRASNSVWYRRGLNSTEMNCERTGNWLQLVKSPTGLTLYEVFMYWDVKLVKPFADYKIYVELENGTKGFFDVSPYLERGIFRELKNVDYFNQVGIVLGAITWPNEQDIAPETLLAGITRVENIPHDSV
jgi:hypothetical protein